jgi:hypothetical protein
MSENSVHTKNRLSIFILQDGFSFLILNELSNPIAFDYVKQKEVDSITELLKLVKSKINAQLIEDYQIETLEVIYGNPQFSIVPDDYFEESHLSHYIKYNSKLIEGDDFSYDDLPVTKAKNVYIPYININNYLFEEFGSFKFTHILSVLIEKGTLGAPPNTEFVSLHLGAQLIYIAAYKNQNLQVANAFECETAEDLAYYVLFTIEELEFDRKQLLIQITGNISHPEHQSAIQLLHNYVKTIEFQNKESSTQFIHQEGFENHFNLL